MAYTNDQVAQFIKSKGIGTNPYALHGYAQQYGVDPSQIDAVQGYSPGTSQNWISQQGFTPQAGQQQVNDDFTNRRGAFANWDAMGQQAQPVSQSSGTASNPYLTAAGVLGGYRGPGAGSVSAMGRSMTNLAGPAQTGGGQRQQDAQNLQALQGAPTGGGWTSVNGQGFGDYGGQPQQTTPNPYLSGVPGQGGFGQGATTQWQAGNMIRGVGDMLNNQVMPNIQNNAVAAGGLGGSRQGVAQGLAIGEATKGLSNGLANLYDNAYGRDQQYDLGSGALDLNVYNSNQNWMRQGQQDQWNFMKDLYGANRQGVQDATTVQNTPMNYFNQFLGNSTQAGGLGGSQTQMLQGNPWLGAAGGYMLGNKLFGG